MYIVIGVGALVVLFIFFYVKMSIDEKKGVNSEEKQKVKEIIKEKTGSDEYMAIYATWETLSFAGSNRTSLVETTSYFYYAIGFKKGNLVVVPLYFEDGVMNYGMSTNYTKKNVYLVNSKFGKNWIELYDKHENNLVSFCVGPVETKEDKFHPVNIVQREEYNAFLKFINEFTQEVNEYNKVEATGKIGKIK